MKDIVNLLMSPFVDSCKWLIKNNQIKSVERRKRKFLKLLDNYSAVCIETNPTLENRLFLPFKKNRGEITSVYSTYTISNIQINLEGKLVVYSSEYGSFVEVINVKRYKK